MSGAVSMTIYLCIKTHRITGLKYLCKTIQDPFRYMGSGTDWLQHLKKYGRSHTTEIIKECKSVSELSNWGRYYSKLFHIVTATDNYGNKIWANRIPETGAGGGNNLCTEDRIKLGKISAARQKIENKHNWSKTGIENCNYSHILYKFQHIATGILLELTQYEFRKRFGYLQGTISALVHGVIKSCDGWKMHGTGTPRQYLNHSFVNIKTGEVVSMSQDNFVRAYNLNRGHVCQLIKQNKHVQSVKGWKLIPHK